MKKKISLLTIGLVIVSALLAILALFNIIELTGVINNIFWTAVTLTAVGLLTLNSADMIGKKNKLALVSLALLLGSAFLVILAFWINIPENIPYFDITIIACILSVLFNMITSNILKLGSNYKIIQAGSYLSFSLVAAFLITTVFEPDLIIKEIRLFLVLVVLSIVGLCLLSVFSKKQGVKDNNSVDATKYVRIGVEEYKDLLAKKEQLEKILASKNDQLSE